MTNFYPMLIWVLTILALHLVDERWNRTATPEETNRDKAKAVAELILYGGSFWFALGLLTWAAEVPR
jgi:hypothetical protein